MFTSLETLLPTTLRKEDIVLALLPHPLVFGRRVSLPLQQRAANSALAISCTWSSLPPASVSPCPAVGGGLCRQSRQVLFRAYRHRCSHATEPGAPTALQLATALLCCHEQQDLLPPRKGEEEDEDSLACGLTLW